MPVIKKTIQQFISTRPELKATLEIMVSFLPWSGEKTPPDGALPIKPVRQWTNYSCTAAVAQMVAAYYGINLSHRKAIELTGCRPDGAILSEVADTLAREYGFQIKTLKTTAAIRKALRRKQPVMTDDSVSFRENHAILLVGETPKGFWIADPRTCEIYWRHEDRYMAGADEAIAVIGKIPVPRLPPRRL